MTTHDSLTITAVPGIDAHASTVMVSVDTAGELPATTDCTQARIRSEQEGSRDSPTSALNSVPASVGTEYIVQKLSSHLQSDWTLWARVMARGSIKSWKNWNGTGKYLELHLVDVGGDQIRATLFNQSVDKFDR